MDVTMITLRRSERIAKLQQSKQISKELGEVKKPRKMKKTNIKPKQVIKTNLAKQKTRKTQKILKIAMDIFETAQDMSQIKINHLFTLIKKRCPIEERSFKYSILQTILKSYKKIGIQNTLQDLSTHMPKVVKYLHLSEHYNIIAVQDALNSIFTFPELMLSSQKKEHTQQTLNTLGLDDIVGMMANTHISQKHLNENDLSALFSRCSVV